MKGLNQKQGIKFGKIFSLVIKMSSIVVSLGMAVSMDLEVKKLVVKMTFLYSNFEEALYIEKTKGFKFKGKKVVCKLKKDFMALNKL